MNIQRTKPPLNKNMAFPDMHVAPLCRTAMYIEVQSDTYCSVDADGLYQSIKSRICKHRYLHSENGRLFYGKKL